MAFRTNKTPVLQTKSASGAVATFNTALAMPLVECKVNFMATRTSEGTPSLVPVSSINLNVNGTTISKSLSENRAGGYIDLVTGKLAVTHIIVVYDGSSDESWGDYPAYNGFRIINYNMKIGSAQTGIANWLDIVPLRTEFGLMLGANSNTIFASQITDNIEGVTDLASWKSYLANHNLEIAIPIPSPIEVQLTPEQITTIIGNNTIFADTGDVDLTYKDLDIAKRGNFREVFRLPS